MSSQLPKPFMAEATPNSSQLAEILLQLKEDDGITRLVQNHSNGFSLSQLTVRDDYDEDEVSNNGVPEVPTLSASEACNCRKSKCLKLYCQCFAGQAVCGQFCRCVDCENRSPSSLTRMIAIKNVLERNPNAFESKYKATTVVNEDDELAAAVAHKNGCRCRKSHCLKKYCECFQGSVHCSIICTCVDCHNREGVPPPLSSTRSLPLTTTEKHKVFSFAVDSGLTANFPDTQVTARALQGLKRNYSESDTVQTDSPPSKTSPTNATTKREEFTRQFSLNSDPGVGSASKPPLVPLIKRRKMEHNGPGMIAGVAASTTTASSSSGSGVPPSTPATGTGVTLSSVLQGTNTPITIRATSPNTLSIAKILGSLLGNSKLSITVQNGVGTPIAEITGDTIEELTAYANNPEQYIASTSTSSTSSTSQRSDSISGPESGENSADTSMEFTDGDVTNSENECNNSKLDKLEDDDMDHDHHPSQHHSRRNSSPSTSLPSNILLSPNSSIVIHVE